MTQNHTEILTATDIIESPPAPWHLVRTGAIAAVALVAVALIVSFLLMLPVAQAQTRGELRIGYQKSASLFVLQKAQGTLEKRLAPLGVSLKWVEFTAGPVQLEALNVGSIDFGDVGEAPPIFAQAAGAPLAYVAASPAAGSETPAATVARAWTEGAVIDLTALLSFDEPVPDISCR